MRSRSTAHTQTVPPGRLGDAPRNLLSARAHMLGREQMADVGAVANRSERVFEREAHRAYELGQSRRFVAEDRERLQRGHALGRRRQLGDVEAAEAPDERRRPSAACTPPDPRAASHVASAIASAGGPV